MIKQFSIQQNYVLPFKVRSGLQMHFRKSVSSNCIIFSVRWSVGLKYVLNYGGYVEGQQYESHCPKRAGITFLCGVYTVLLSCVYSNLLKFKFAQAVYAHRYMTSSLRRGANFAFALLGSYAAWIGC
jgi:hypothetical protein